ncbi:MAG: hypothetical protein KAI66_02205 [Lentisphaeria bacterium]|nr:hypothetical protein [Lentisphaeria bacterium]
MAEITGNLLIGWASESLVPDRPALLRGMPTARVGKEIHDPTKEWRQYSVFELERISDRINRIDGIGASACLRSRTHSRMPHPVHPVNPVKFRSSSWESARELPGWKP